MDKISTAKIAKVLTDTKNALLAVTDERDKLAEKCALLERRSEAEKVAAVMHSKGVHLDVERDDLVADLEKAAEDGRLPVLTEALDMVGPNMGITGTLASNEELRGSGGNALESFLLGDVG
jgi:hypothetical protein